MKRRRDRKRGRSAKLWKQGERHCVYCGVRLVPNGNGPNRISADHVKPISKGGYDKFRNIVASCLSCNGRKGALSREEFLNSNGGGK